MGKAQAPFARCPGPPDMKTLRTHGIDVKPGPGKTATIYAVAHGGRESIEVFRIDASRDEPAVTWTGCLVLPKNASGNAVVALSGGRLAVSKFANADDEQSIDHILAGQVTARSNLDPRQGLRRTARDRAFRRQRHGRQQGRQVALPERLRQQGHLQGPARPLRRDHPRQDRLPPRQPALGAGRQDHRHRPVRGPEQPQRPARLGRREDRPRHP
ncbi:MAG: hypothetical protein WDN45_18895 [Caulobacteraceae bacterium]